MTKRPKQTSGSKQPDGGFERYLAAIELDEDYIEGLRAAVGTRHDWFYEAASGAVAGLSEMDRGRAAYIFGRLSGEKGLAKLAKLSEHDLPLVRGNAIGAIAVTAGQPAANFLLELAANRTRPAIDRMQALTCLGQRSETDELGSLVTLDLTDEPEELQYRIALLLEQHNLRG